MSFDFDALVVGSGITGGWAAKELTERGLAVALLERGKPVQHRNYPTEFLQPWDLELRGFAEREQGGFLRGTSPLVFHWFTRREEAPYETPEGRPYDWQRAHHLGGRSLVWGRLAVRLSEQDFLANKQDGHGSDWPIRYHDLAPWYDRVEEFIGVSGNRDGIASMPDGQFDPGMPFFPVEQHMRRILKEKFGDRELIMGRTANLTREREGRDLCQYRDQCVRGCSFGGYFSTLSSTLPAAEKTGRLTVLTNRLVTDVSLNREGNRAEAVNVIDTISGETARISARIIVLCASTLSSVQILLQSRSENHPEGIGSRSGVLGRYIMDHPKPISVTGLLPAFTDQYFSGRRPAMPVIPRYVNLDKNSTNEFTRGYYHQVISMRASWSRGAFMPGIGAQFKDSLSKPGSWILAMPTMIECLPYRDNRVTLSTRQVDSYGQPQLHIDVRYRDNEQKAMNHARDNAVAMMKAWGAQVISTNASSAEPGSTNHEMGGARMGKSPLNSVLNEWNQVHDVPNLLVTDGAAMVSSGCNNPSLTYMAMTARAVNHAVDLLSEGTI